MEKREYTSQSEIDWPTIAIDLIESTWKTVAGLIAELWKENIIYSLSISTSENSPELIVELIQNLITKIQENRDSSFIIDLEIPNSSIERDYTDVAKTLINENYIDSYRIIQTKNTSKKHIHLMCE